MTMFRTALAVLAVFGVTGTTQLSAQTASPPGAKVYIINLKDGGECEQPVPGAIWIDGNGRGFGWCGKAQHRHHHLLIDTALSSEELKGAIPADDTYKLRGLLGPTETMSPFREASTRFSWYLPTGRHFPHQPSVMSTPITVTVR